jgi:hypothetical protein
MATSTIPAFLNGLYDRLTADSVVGLVQVCDGLPWPKALEREAVLIVAARPGDPTGGAGGQHAAAIGRQSREERYVVDVVVTVLKPVRETQKVARDRAFELVAAIENSIRTWGAEATPFGGLVRVAQVTGTTLEQPAGNDDREALVSIQIACQQRI